MMSSSIAIVIYIVSHFVGIFFWTHLCWANEKDKNSCKNIYNLPEAYAQARLEALVVYYLVTFTLACISFIFITDLLQLKAVVLWFQLYSAAVCMTIAIGLYTSNVAQCYLYGELYDSYYTHIPLIGYIMFTAMHGIMGPLIL